MKFEKYDSKRTFKDTKTGDEIAVFYFDNAYGVVVTKKANAERWETLLFCGNNILNDKESVANYLRQIERLRGDHRAKFEDL